MVIQYFSIAALRHFRTSHLQHSRAGAAGWALRAGGLPRASGSASRAARGHPSLSPDRAARPWPRRPGHRFPATRGPPSAGTRPVAARLGRGDRRALVCGLDDSPPPPRRSARLRDPGPENEKAAPRGGSVVASAGLGSALTCFVLLLGLVDHIDPALTAHHAAVAVTLFERAKRVPDLHGPLLSSRRVAAPWVDGNAALRRRVQILLPLKEHGEQYWDRTSDPYDVNVVLYR